MQQMSFSAIGTKWSISTKSTIDDAEWSRIERVVKECISAFDASFSRFREDSWVTRVYKRPGIHQLPPHGYELLCFYEKLYQVTNGLVSPLIGRLMEEAGYDAAYTLKSGTLKQPDKWEDVMRYDLHQLTTTKPVLLDFGAAGKGYLVGQVGDVLKKSGVDSYVINAGGDILHVDSDDESIVVGLEDPLDTSQVVGTVTLNNHSLCASAGSRRKWGAFHHIINPQSLDSPRDILATWVEAADTMTADGIATALFFVPARVLRQKFIFEHAILRSDMSLVYSGNLSIQLNEVERS